MGTIREIIRKDGSSTFHAEVRLKGAKPVRESFRTRSKAKQWIQDTESAIRDGRYIKVSEAKRHTVGEMISRFVEQWLPRNPKSQLKQTALLNWWKKTCGHILLCDLRPATIAECRDHLLSESTMRGGLRSPSTVNRYLSAFGKVLTIAIKEWGWLEDNPMSKISKPPEAPGRERFLSPEEKKRLLEACKVSSNPNLFPMVAISLITALRYGELTGLRWRDISMEQRSITLRKTKNGDRRVIPLTEEAEKLFRSCPSFGTSPDSLVFCSNRFIDKEQKISIRGVFETALRMADIKNFTWHDLRHTACSYMSMAGGTQSELMAILGHRSPKMTYRYSHYSQKHLRDLLERFDTNVGKINTRGE